MIFSSHIFWNGIKFLLAAFSHVGCKFYLLLSCIFSLSAHHTKDLVDVWKTKGFSFIYRQENTDTSFFILSVLCTSNNSLTSWSKIIVVKSHLQHMNYQGQNTAQLPADKLLTLPAMQLNYFWQGWKVLNS